MTPETEVETFLRAYAVELEQNRDELENENAVLVLALRRAGSELEAGNDRKAKHIIQDALGGQA